MKISVFRWGAEYLAVLFINVLLGLFSPHLTEISRLFGYYYLYIPRAGIFSTVIEWLFSPFVIIIEAFWGVYEVFIGERVLFFLIYFFVVFGAVVLAYRIGWDLDAKARVGKWFMWSVLWFMICAISSFMIALAGH